MPAQPKTTQSNYRVVKYASTRGIPSSPATPVAHRMPASGQEVPPAVVTIIPVIRNGFIALRCFNDGDGYDRKADTKGRGNDPANYIGTPVALLRIIESESMERGGTLHTMLSDGNILRNDQHIGDNEGGMSDGGERVVRAILGTILAHCNDEHVVDRRLMVGDEPQNGIYRGRKFVLRIVCNRHELLKLFFAIQASIPNGTTPHAPHPLKTYSIQSYSEVEISALLCSALSIGKIFHVNPSPVSDRTRQAYEVRRGEVCRGIANRSSSEIPVALMMLAHTAVILEERAQTRKLFWN